MAHWPGCIAGRLCLYTVMTFGHAELLCSALLLAAHGSPVTGYVIDKLRLLLVMFRTMVSKLLWTCPVVNDTRNTEEAQVCMV